MNTAVILIGGSGTRMGAKCPKQFMDLNGRPLVFYTIRAFEDCVKEGIIGKIIIVSRKEDIDFVKSDIVQKYGFDSVEKVAAGGRSRLESSYEGLKAAEGSDIVLLHDGARPFITKELVKKCVDAAKKHGAAFPGLPLKDTVRKKEDRFGTLVIKRDDFVLVQTPQAFKHEIAIKAFDKLLSAPGGKKDFSEFTDDAMAVYEMLGVKSFIVDGDFKNIKITTPEDIIYAKALCGPGL